MRRKTSLSLFGIMIVLLIGSLGVSAVFPAEQPDPNDLPKSWDIAEIQKATPPYGADGQVYVLAWKVEEDDRPLKVERCLVLRVLDKDDGYGRWCLASLYRHPDDKTPEWRLSMIHVLGEKGTKTYPGMWIHHSKRFKEKPGNKELYATLPLEDIRWSFDPDKDWKLVNSGVCEKNWETAIGEKPTKFFSK